ncbi:hypothetical protein [Saliphagus sp. LR7]|uniref:hypothetical protein n=1 Tax=Saliphagus sp. LR7 TaxID=2282654 RepID=UPI000DF74621|nr:hypothetical protein [Saliphagus sp. LR7]
MDDSVSDEGDGAEDVDLDSIEADLDRATDLETAEAIEVLREAKGDLETVRGDPAVDTGRREELENRLDQRIREIDERDAYDGGLGASMNPEDDEAP